MSKPLAGQEKGNRVWRVQKKEPGEKKAYESNSSFRDGARAGGKKK